MIEISKNRPITDAYLHVVESYSFANIPEWKRDVIKKANDNRRKEAATLTPSKFAADLKKPGHHVILTGKSFELLTSTVDKSRCGRINVFLLDDDASERPSVRVVVDSHPKGDYGEDFRNDVDAYVNRNVPWLKYVKSSPFNDEASVTYTTEAPEVVNAYFKLTGQDDRRTDFEQGTLL